MGWCAARIKLTLLCFNDNKGFNMFIRSVVFFMVILLVSCATEKPVNGFDSACLIFKEATTKNLNPEELGIYIAEELEKLGGQFASKEVNEVFHALFNVAPEERYGLFKQSAEYTLKRDWDCDAIKSLYQAR